MTAQSRKFVFSTIRRINDMVKSPVKSRVGRLDYKGKCIRMIHTDDVPLEVYLRRKMNNNS